MASNQKKEGKLDSLNATSKDPDLDITNEKFDPIKALYSTDFRVTNKNPKVLYQNMAALETALNRNGIWGLNKPTKNEPTTSKTSSKSDEQLHRRFKEHQMPVKYQIKNRHQRNLVKQMEKTEGPLAKLQEYIKSQQRIHIVIRKHNGIRGYLLGYVQCFDRHWNLLLTEVEEHYQQRKYKYAQQKLLLPSESNEAECLKRLQCLAITLPSQNVKSLNRKNVQVVRKIEQLFLRGEHIVLIRQAQATNAANP